MWSVVTRKQPETVDAYIASAPKEVRGKLREMRAAIRKAAPHATEGIGYKIPFYDYKGWLAWFSYQSTYIGFYLRPPVIEQHKKELAGYFTTKSAVHFPLEEKLPLSLVTTLVRARVGMNEAEKKGK